MAVTNLKEFNKSLERFAKRTVPAQLVLFQRKIALDVLKGVVLKTPVDTGRARGGWQVGINQAPEGEPGRKGSGAEAEATEGNVGAAGSAAIAAGMGELASVPPFAVVWITNNVSYIVYLEHGSSDQAPQGMISGTLAEIMGTFET
jgi:hypothetical protein